jgi:hypothetical protein
MDLKDLINTAWKGLDSLEAAGIAWTVRVHPQDVTKRYRTDGQPALVVGDDRMGNWYVDVRPYHEVADVLTALEHAFGHPSRECTMDGERCLHWELGDVQVVATPSYLQLTLRQPDINNEPDPKRMVN